jgi:hypothetical protein
MLSQLGIAQALDFSVLNMRRKDAKIQFLCTQRLIGPNAHANKGLPRNPAELLSNQPPPRDGIFLSSCGLSGWDMEAM